MNNKRTAKTKIKIFAFNKNEDMKGLVFTYKVKETQVSGIKYQD